MNQIERVKQLLRMGISEEKLQQNFTKIIIEKAKKELKDNQKLKGGDKNVN